MSLWHQCLRRLEAELPEQAFNTWIRPLQAVEDGGRLRLLAPNRYVVDWVNQNAAGRIGELIEELVPAPVPLVSVEIGSRRPAAPAPAPLMQGIGVPNPNGRPATRPQAPSPTPVTMTTDPLPQFGGRRLPTLTGPQPAPRIPDSRSFSTIRLADSSALARVVSM